jgi:cytochrome P450
MTDIPEISEIPVLADDPFDSENLANPYAWFESIRAAGPIVWFEKYGVYCTGRFEQVDAILRDWRNFTSTGGPGLSDIRKPGNWRTPGAIVEADPPAHSQIRGAMNKILSPRVIRDWREAFDKEAEQLTSAIATAGRFDAVSDLIEPFILKIFPDALGTRMSERENLLILGNHGFNAVGPMNALFFETESQMKEIALWAEENHRRESLLPGGFGEKIFEAEADGQLPQGTALSLLRTLLRGGLDTTISGMGTLLRLLAQNPDQWALLKSDFGLIGNALDEALRLESPIQTFYRTTVGEVDFAGHRLKDDTKVQVYTGAANRDPARWEDPDRFDITRKTAGHVAFGAGVHNCLGKMMAKSETESLFTALLKRIRTIELDGEFSHRPINTLRTLQSLPLRVTLE